MRERQLQATLEFTFADAGAEYVAYTSIVAGEDGTTLHYTTNHKELKAGNLIVIDAGGEWQGYASDITRTIPVSGKFSIAQRQLYDLVLQANIKGIALAKPGSSLNKIHARCEDVLRAGARSIGHSFPGSKNPAGRAGCYRESQSARHRERIAHLARRLHAWNQSLHGS